MTVAKTNLCLFLQEMSTKPAANHNKNRDRGDKKSMQKTTNPLRFQSTRQR